MGCGASTAVPAICTGQLELSAAKEALGGPLTVTIPDMPANTTLCTLTHDIHGPLVKRKTVVSGRPSKRMWEVALTGAPGDKITVILKENGHTRFAEIVPAAGE